MKAGKVHGSKKCRCGAAIQYYGPPLVAYVCTQTGQLPINCNQPVMETEEIEEVESDGKEEEN